MKKSMKQIAYILFIILCYSPALYVAGCSPEDRRFTNLYVKWKGEDPSTVFVKKADGPWVEYANNEFFHLEFICFENDLKEPMYRLSYAGDFEFNYVYFDGYYNFSKNKDGVMEQNDSMELPIDYKTPFSFSSTARRLDRSEYMLSLSKVNW